MKDTIVVEKIKNNIKLEDVFAVRREVFVEEQECPVDLEFEFEEESTHFLALVNDTPAGAARWRKTPKGYKLERFAVSKNYRGKGVGQELVRAVLNDLPLEASCVYLYAQVTAIGLYEKFGFQRVGQPFEEAGIQHYEMMLMEAS